MQEEKPAASQGLPAESVRTLLRAARAARSNAYAPYSHYPVGAAVLTGDGTVFTGTNVENASYGLTVCAERVAVFSAVSAGHKDIVALAVVGPDGGEVSPPCGSCRQVLAEFNPELPVILPHNDPPTEFEVVSLAQLLPRAFGRAQLWRGYNEAHHHDELYD